MYGTFRFQNTSPYERCSTRYDDSNRRSKRRGVSPKIYPRKVHITEEKVASDLCNLRISEHWQGTKHCGKLRNSPRKSRTFTEIENSLELSSEDEDETVASTFKVSAEFQEQIDSLKLDLFTGKAQKASIPVYIKPDYSTAVVLWKPPAGTVPDLLKNLTAPTNMNTHKEEVEDNTRISVTDAAPFENTLARSYENKNYALNDLCTNFRQRTPLFLDQMTLCKSEIEDNAMEL